MPILRSIERPTWLVRIVNYEYWPWWMFFIPMLPVWLWYALRMRSLAWFTASNPSIEYGGFFGESKIDILDHIPAKYKARSLYFKKGVKEDEVMRILEEQGISFPLILKPNVGERGGDVELILSSESLSRYLGLHNDNLIVQEYIESAYEFGVLYHRMPNQAKGSITSLVLKEFMEVKGDGESSVRKLLKDSARASFQLHRWEQEKPQLLSLVPELNEKIQVEKIGNHCLGTKFLDANALINHKLEEAFDEIVTDYTGFCYGRFDLKADSLDGFKEGKGIRIFELNGVSSEPGHIYDPKHSIWYAYGQLYKHWHIIYKVANENVRQGFTLPRAKDVFLTGYRHFQDKKTSA